MVIIATVGLTAVGFSSLQLSGVLSSLDSCGSSNAFFSVPVVDVGNLVGIVPLGNLNPTGHVFPTDHVYLSVRQESTVYAPGDVTITSISSSEQLGEDPAYVDYSVYFSPCRELRFYFHHVNSLSDKLTAGLARTGSFCQEYSTGGQAYRRCNVTINILVRAGEVLGTAGRRYPTFDLGAYDMRTGPLVYANPSRWREESFHVVCPLDYYEAGAGEVLRGFLGGWGGTKRTVAPVCGRVDQDLPGTVQGVWFAKGLAWDHEDAHLALVHDNVDPSQPRFSVGTSVTGLNPGVYQFAAEGSGLVNRDFSDVVSDGNVYCYELQQQYGGALFVALVQLTSSTELWVEKNGLQSCGSGPWAFEPNAIIFER